MTTTPSVVRAGFDDALDNLAKAGESGAPPWEVIIVRYGARSTVRSDVYLNYGLYHTEDGPIDMDYFFWILRTGDRTILVDSGFSRAGGESRGRTTLVVPAEAYTALGVDPATAPPIILTHAHYDHTGNLDLFPASEIIVAQAEFDFWMGPSSRHVQFQHSAEAPDLEYLSSAADEGRLRTYSGRHTVAPGVEAIEVGGHTPGQAVVLVNTTEGVVLLASDAVHYYEEGESDMPFSSVEHLSAMYSGFELFREYLASGRVATMVSGHDPSTLSRFRPSTGPLGENVSTIGEPNDRTM